MSLLVNKIRRAYVAVSQGNFSSAAVIAANVLQNAAMQAGAGDKSAETEALMGHASNIIELIGKVAKASMVPAEAVATAMSEAASEVSTGNGR